MYMPSWRAFQARHVQQPAVSPSVDMVSKYRFTIASLSFRGTRKIPLANSGQNAKR